MMGLSLICLGQDSLSFLLRPKLTSCNTQVLFWKVSSLCVCAYSENQEHKGTFSVIQSDIRHFLVYNQKRTHFFVLAVFSNLGVKSVPFLFWIYSNEWLLKLASAYVRKVSCCPISSSVTEGLGLGTSVLLISSAENEPHIKQGQALDSPNAYILTRERATRLPK